MQNDYLADDAADDLLIILRWSLLFGIIGPDTFIARIAALRDMCRPASNIYRYCTTILIAEEWKHEDSEFKEDSADSDGHASVLVGELPFELKEPLGKDVQDEFVIYFIPSISPNLNSWEFHKGDLDPYPSIPHGHGISDSRRKLDPYLGNVYRKSHPHGRVSRRDIIALWNNLPFRQFAFEAIQHFSQANPKWNWRVENPLRLPKRR